MTPPVTGPVHIRMVQANLESPNSRAKFLADLTTVSAQEPDFLSLNEVGRRSEADLTSGGYAIWRSDGLYPGETPVLWNPHRWHLLDHGTTTISDRPGVPPHKKDQLGLRYANWVTLRAKDGQVLSIVSTHFAPAISSWPNLLPTEIANLGNLTDTLAAKGPVLVGGDLNVNYRSHAYPAELLRQYRLEPTYDLLGQRLPTGNYHGATIDYTLLRQNTQLLTPTGQFTTALNSDHDALTTDWTLTSP